MRSALHSLAAIFLTVLALCGIPSTAQGSRLFQKAASLGTARFNHSATRLADGRILVVGGPGPAEIYDSATGIFSPAGQTSVNREEHTATLLPDNRVLLIGGLTPAANEVYDPVTGNWTTFPSGELSRLRHTTTRLADGSILVAGGYSEHRITDVAEIYNPSTGTWSRTGTMKSPREGHTATALPNGKVLVIGGQQLGELSGSAELYDPATGSWTMTDPFPARIYQHTATLLDGGVVLAVGHSISESGIEVAAIYSPETGRWTTSSQPLIPRTGGTATLLQDQTVLFCSGDESSGAQIYAPSTDRWSFTASPVIGRAYHSATLLDDGNVLIIGGETRSREPRSAIRESELYAPTTTAWAESGSLNQVRDGHTATTLRNGKILVAGGSAFLNGEIHPSQLATCELYDPSTGLWEPTGPMAKAREHHQAVLLADGKVLVVGAGSEIYDPGTGTWRAAGGYPQDFAAGTLTLLGDGRVLAAGGPAYPASRKTCYLYTPAKNQWAITGSMSIGRRDHTATLLRNGKVFVHGGRESNDYYMQTRACEIYDPTTGKWTAGLRSGQTRERHTATLLPGGQVLVIGGSGMVTRTRWSIEKLDSAEIYDPVNNEWKTVSPLIKPQSGHSTVSLSDGRILIAGDDLDLPRPYLGSNLVQIYDTASDTWMLGPVLVTPRAEFSFSKLSDGRLFVVGGKGPLMLSSIEVQAANNEIYDPVLPYLTVEQPAGAMVARSDSRTFGTVLTGTTTSLVFRISNRGTTNLEELSATLSGTHAGLFAISPFSSSPMAPGGSRAFTIRFSPDSPGTKNANLRISDNDAGQVFEIKLSGNAMLPAAEISVQQPAGKEMADGESKRKFGTSIVGKKGISRTFTIKNTGTAKLTGIVVKTRDKHKDDFILGRLSKTSLAPGEKTSFKLTFKPSKKGPRQAILRISSNDADESSFDISLAGEGAIR